MDRVNALLTTSVVMILVGMGTLIFKKTEPQPVDRKKVFSAFYNKNAQPKNKLLQKTTTASPTSAPSLDSDFTSMELSPPAPSESSTLAQSSKQLLGLEGLEGPEIREALLEKLDRLRHQQQKQNEFLKRKVGLTEDQIKMVHLKTFMLQKELKTANLLAQKRIPAAHTVKRSAIERHIVWMSYTLGAQNFEEYLNL